MTRLLSSALLVIGFHASAFAGVLTLEKGPTAVENVNVAKSATIGFNGKTETLENIGAGLRAKKVLGMSVKVYVGQLLISAPTKFSRDPKKALSSLDGSDVVAMQLTFLRDVEADKVQVSLRDALVANKVDLKKPEIKALLAAVVQGGEAKSGKALVFVTKKYADGSEVLVYEANGGKAVTIKGEKGFTQSVFSMWLGVPADEGTAALKERVVKGN
ncbi:MAG: chalcone isomerase family protein [Pseudobdellovibrionaceae bacterium]